MSAQAFITRVFQRASTTTTTATTRPMHRQIQNMTAPTLGVVLPKQPTRYFSTTDDDASLTTATVDTSTLLDAFRDPLSRADRTEAPVGRSWTVKELRRKSFDDLHKLWYVLYKERNMLLTEKVLCRRNQVALVQPDRIRKVQKSMGAIRHVLGERKRERIANKLKSLSAEREGAEGAVFDDEEPNNRMEDDDDDDEDNTMDESSGEEEKSEAQQDQQQQKV